MSGLVGKVQLKLEIVPVRVEHGTPRYDTVMSDNWKLKDEGLVSAIAIVWPVLVAVETTGVAAVLNVYEQSEQRAGIDLTEIWRAGVDEAVYKKS